MCPSVCSADYAQLIKQPLVTRPLTSPHVISDTKMANYIRQTYLIRTTRLALRATFTPCFISCCNCPSDSYSVRPPQHTLEPSTLSRTAHTSTSNCNPVGKLTRPTNAELLYFQRLSRGISVELFSEKINRVIKENPCDRKTQL